MFNYTSFVNDERCSTWTKKNLMWIYCGIFQGLHVSIAIKQTREKNCFLWWFDLSFSALSTTRNKKISQRFWIKEKQLQNKILCQFKGGWGVNVEKEKIDQVRRI